MNLKRILSHLGWDGMLLGVAGFAAIAIGILDFTPLLNLTNDPILRMLLSGIGLLLTAVVAQTSQRATEISELRQALGEAEVEILDMKFGFPQHVAQSVSKAQKFVLDTNLNADVPRLPGSSPQQLYRDIRDKRLRKGEIGFRQVVSIFHKEGLVSLVEKLLTYSGTDYFIRHYDPPSKAIPILHIMSFDNEHFYLGGFYSAESPTEERAIYIRHPKVAQLLSEYWQILWLRATPLNEGRLINWDELRRIRARVGMTDEEFDQMVERLKSEIDPTAETQKSEHD